MNGIAMFVVFALTASPSTLMVDEKGVIEESAKRDTLEEPSSRKPSVKETIVVTATRTERRIDEVPFSMTILRGEEVEDTSGVGPDNVFKNIPAVFVRPSSATMVYPDQNRVSMRGISGNSVLVMIDGVPMNDAQRGYIAWNKIVLETVEQVEVVRGASASLFGNYASGGTINLITRPIDQSDYSLLLSAGTEGTRRLGLQLDHTATESFGWGLNLTSFDTDGFIRPIPEIRGPIDTPNWSENHNALLRVEVHPTPAFRARLRANYFEDDRSQGQPSSWNKRRGIDLGLTGHRATGLDGDIAFSAFHQTTDFDGQNVVLNPARTAEMVANQQFADVESYGGSLQWSRSVSPEVPLVTIGLDTLFVKATEIQDAFIGTPGITTTGGEQQAGGLFAEASWKLSRRTEILVSGRVDYWKNYDGFRSDTDGTRTDYVENETIQFDPRISIRREVSDRLAVRGTLSRAFNAPRLRDLYRVAAGRGTLVEPNPNLEPEIVTGVEAGMVATGARSRAELNVFWNEIDDTLNSVNLALTPIIIAQIQNVGQARSRGFELIGAYAPSPRWTLTGSWIRTKTEITDNPSSPALVGKQLTDIPEDALFSSLRFRSSRGLTAEIQGRYLSRIYGDAANQRWLDPHAIVDFSASLPIRERLRLLVIGSNLLDREYIGEYIIEKRLGAPRQYFAGFRYSAPFGR